MTVRQRSVWEPTFCPFPGSSLYFLAHFVTGNCSVDLGICHSNFVLYSTLDLWTLVPLFSLGVVYTLFGLYVPTDANQAFQHQFHHIPCLRAAVFLIPGVFSFVLRGNWCKRMNKNNPDEMLWFSPRHLSNTTSESSFSLDIVFTNLQRVQAVLLSLPDGLVSVKIFPVALLMLARAVFTNQKPVAAVQFNKTRTRHDYQFFSIVNRNLKCFASWERDNLPENHLSVRKLITTNAKPVLKYLIIIVLLYFL